jgi:hypothetical protein
MAITLADRSVSGQVPADRGFQILAGGQARQHADTLGNYRRAAWQRLRGQAHPAMCRRVRRPYEPWAGEGGATSGRGTSEGSRTRRSRCRAGSGGGRRECARTCTVPCGRSLRSSRCAPHVRYPSRTGQANIAAVTVIKGHMAVITIPRAATPCPGAVLTPIRGEIQWRTAQDPKEHTARAGLVA